MVRRKLAHPMIYLVIVCLCTGPVVAQIGAPADDINVIGILVQCSSVFQTNWGGYQTVCLPEV